MHIIRNERSVPHTWYTHMGSWISPTTLFIPFKDPVGSVCPPWSSGFLTNVHPHFPEHSAWPIFDEEIREWKAGLPSNIYSKPIAVSGNTYCKGFQRLAAAASGKLNVRCGRRVWLQMQAEFSDNSSFCSPIGSPREFWTHQYCKTSCFVGSRLFRQSQNT